VILSHGLWERRFGSDPRIVSQKLVINGQPFTVVGVAPRGFYFRRKGRDLWMPLVVDRAALGPRDDRWMELYGRLAPGVSIERARADLAGLAAQFRRDYPQTYPPKSGYGIAAVPYLEEVVGTIRPALLMLGAAVGLVLLIACANVANLLLARATTRDREVAMRAALGAGRGGLVRQFLTESLLLAVLGGGLGLVLAWWGVRAAVKINPDRIPRLDEVTIDGRVLAFTVLVSVATGVLFGLVPALQLSRGDFLTALKEGSKGSGGKLRRLARQALVVLEVAVALLVLVGAGLLVESFLRLERVDPGFRTDHLLTLEVLLPAKQYPGGTQWAAFFSRLLDRLAALPQVRSAGATNAVPLGVVTWDGEIEVEGRPRAPGQLNPSVGWRVSSPSYFATMGIPLRAGRVFTDADDDRSQQVVVVEVGLAQSLWPGRDPVGRRLKLKGQGASEAWRTVVGVVGDVRHEGPESVPHKMLYVPIRQFPQIFSYVVLRTTGDPLAVVTAARRAVMDIDPNQAVYRVETMGEKLARATAWRRFYTLLLGAFAAVSLVLAIVGVYGVMAYSVAQRTREIGIRMALGARRQGVVGLVLRQALTLTLIGAGLGLAVSLGLTRAVSGLLYGVAATDLATFTGACLVLAAFAALAGYLPARRASRIDPVTALRVE
jgi:putative ABC transport system permease protein